VPGAEIRAGPAVESAGYRMLYGQDGDSDRERNEEEDCGEQPEQNRARAGMCGRCDPARADDTGDGEESEIAEPEFALEVSRNQLMSSLIRSASFGTTTGRLPKLGWIGQSSGPFSWPV